MQVRKRVLSLLLCLVMAASALPSVLASEADAPFSLSQVNLFDFENGKTVTAEIKAVNTTNQPQAGQLILAMYDAATNAMEGYTETPIRLEANARFTKKVQLAVPEKGEFVLRAFVWDNLQRDNLLSNVLPVQYPAPSIGTVTLSIEKRTINKRDVLAPTQVDLLEGDTLWSLLKREMDQRDIPYRAPYNPGHDSISLEVIDGDGKGSHGEASGWISYLNENKVMVDPAKCTLADGNVLRICYSLDNGEDVDHPVNIPAVEGIPESWENDLWLEDYFCQITMEDHFQILPYRAPEIPKDSPDAAPVYLPATYFPIYGQDVVSVSDTGNITPLKEGVAIILVSYGEVIKEDQSRYPACDPVNRTYFTVAVNNNPAEIKINTDLDTMNQDPLDGVNHTKGTRFDTVYFSKGATVDYPFTVTAPGADLRVTCNGNLLYGENGNYTAKLQNSANVIEITAELDGKTKVQAYTIDARKIQVRIENLSRPGASFLVGDEAGISFTGITMPVQNLSGVYEVITSPAPAICYSTGGSEVYARCTGTDLASNNTLHYICSSSGDHSFTNGCIDIQWKDLRTPETPAVISARTSSLPDFSIAVSVPTVNEKLAQGVDRLIRDIGTVTLNSKDAIEKAMTEYDKLRDEQKALVTRYEELVQADRTLTELKADRDSAEQVVKKIKKLPSNPDDITVQHQKELETIREEYEALTDRQKSMISEADLNILIASENALQKLLDQDLAAALSKEIMNVCKNPDQLTLENEEAVLGLNNRYREMTPQQQSFVTAEAAEKLKASMEQLKKLNLEVVNAWHDAVTGLGDPSGLGAENTEAVQALRAAYEKFSPSQKLLVREDIYKILLQAEAKVDEENQKKADVVINSIEKLHQLPLDPTKPETIKEEYIKELERRLKEIDTAYGNLTPAQKEIIDHDTAAQAMWKKAQSDLVYYQNVLAANKLDYLILTIAKDVESVKEITLDQADKLETIQKAAEQYQQLSEDQRSFVTKLPILEAAQQHVKQLQDQLEVQKVIDQLNTLPAPELVEEKHRTQIEQARTAVTALEEKGLKADDAHIQTWNAAMKKLEDAEQALANLANKKIAQEVDAQIASLGENITVESRADILTARAAYNLLTPKQQEYVTMLDVLQKAESSYDRQMAQAVYDKIAMISTTSLGSEGYQAAVQQAREAYDLLTENQQSMITNLSELEDAEALLKNREAILNVERKIDAIKEATLTYQPVIVEARTAYDALSAEQQAMVSAEKLDILKKSEAAIAQLAVQAVTQQITLIGDPELVTTDHAEKIRAARKAYDALTPDQQKDVPNADALSKAEQSLAKVQAKYAAEQVNSQISAIDPKITMESQDAVQAARKAYDALTQEQKSMISPEVTEALETYETELASLKDAEAARSVNQKIADLGKITLQSKQKLRNARIAYNALSPSQQTKADIETLRKAEKEFYGLNSTQVQVKLSLENNSFFSLASQQTDLTADLAESYGYPDHIKDGISAMDALVKAHQLVYGKDFTKETKDQYLAVSEDGTVTTMLKQENISAGLIIDNFVPHDGILTEDGVYTPTLLTDTRIFSGDDIRFFLYHPDGYYSETYAAFQTETGFVNELSVQAGRQNTLCLKGYLIKTEGLKPKLPLAPVKNTQLCILTADGENKGKLIPIDGAVTDETGTTRVTFGDRGVYYLAAVSNEENGTYVISQILKVTVG